MAKLVGKAESCRQDPRILLTNIDATQHIKIPELKFTVLKQDAEFPSLNKGSVAL